MALAVYDNGVNPMCVKVDEALNWLGSNKCTDDNECDGTRTCSNNGWCEGTNTCEEIYEVTHFVCEFTDAPPAEMYCTGGYLEWNEHSEPYCYCYNVLEEALSVFPPPFSFPQPFNLAPLNPNRSLPLSKSN